MRFELHAHSTHSDGTGTPKEMVDSARKFLDGLAITDHDAIAGSVEALSYAAPGFTVISGMEVSAKEGHILALNIRTLVPRGMGAADTVEMIHSLGGIAIACHPYDTYREGVGDLILKLPFDAVEVLNGHTFGNLKDPVRVCKEHDLPMVGGSDAHTPGEIGSVTVEFEGELASAIRSRSVKVRSKPAAQLLFNHGVSLIGRKIRKRLSRR